MVGTRILNCDPVVCDAERIVTYKYVRSKPAQRLANESHLLTNPSLSDLPYANPFCPQKPVLIRRNDTRYYHVHRCLTWGRKDRFLIWGLYTDITYSLGTRSRPIARLVPMYAFPGELRTPSPRSSAYGNYSPSLAVYSVKPISLSAQ